MSFAHEILNKFKAPKQVNNFAWAQDLKGLDDISAIEHATLHLNTNFKMGLLNHEHYLQALLAIDEKIHIIVEGITTHYINIDNIGVELEDRFSNSIFLYHRQIFLVYLSLIEHVAPIAHTALPLIIGRAMKSATEMIKWRYYNYQSAPANVWLQISKLYLTGKQHQLLDEAITLYDDYAPSSLSTLYIHACMLGTVESLSFKRQQISLVSKMLEKWAPKQLSLEEFIGNKHFMPTLEVLRTEWSRNDYKRQRRGEARIKAVQPATTAYGFKDTCYQIKQYENLLVQRGEKPYQGEKSFDERIAAHYVIKSRAEPNVIYVDLGAGYSNIVDESARGLGLQISKQANEVSIGMMVGVSVREKKYGTRVGVIRSIKPIGSKELQVGVEVLSRNAFYTEAKNMSIKHAKVSGDYNGDALSLNSRGVNFSCLFLPQEPGISAQETLIIPRLEHNNRDMFMVNILGNSVVVKFTESLERHEDWVRVAFTKV